MEKKAKEEFIENFLFKYVKNYNYRLEVHNKFILFINHHYWGIVSNILDICNIGINTDTKLFFDITIDHIV